MLEVGLQMITRVAIDKGILTLGVHSSDDRVAVAVDFPRTADFRGISYGLTPVRSPLVSGRLYLGPSRLAAESPYL